MKHPVAPMSAHEAGVIGFSQGNFTVRSNETEDRKLQELALRLLVDESGITLVEYGIVIGLIALASIVALTSLKANIASLLGAVGNQITSSS